MRAKLCAAQRRGCSISNATTVSRRSFLGRSAALLGTAAAVRPAPAARGTAVAPIAFAHIAVRARDLDKTLDWYKKVLGIRLSLRTGRGAFATYDEEHHRISFFSRPRMGALPADLGGFERMAFGLPADLGGFERMAFGYAAREDLSYVYRRLKANGILPYRAAEYGPITALYYRDPSGLNIELSVASPVTPEELYEYCADGCVIDGARTRRIDAERLLGRGAAVAAGAPARKPSAPTHTVLKTARFEQMIEWYRTVFPARVQFQNDRVCFLSYAADRKPTAIVRQTQVTAPGPTYGFDHYAFEYATMRDLAVNVYARLKEQGILPYWTTNHGMTTSFYYADPRPQPHRAASGQFPHEEGVHGLHRGPGLRPATSSASTSTATTSQRWSKAALLMKRCTAASKAPRTTPVPSPYR